MTISIALAVYNGARYLQEQLDSIAEQSRQPDEVVISDNRSTDATVRIIERFVPSVTFPVRVYIQDANVGVGQNFGRAISLCRGDVICLADCDDVWYPTKLQQVEEALSASPSVGLLFSDADLVDENLTQLGTSLHERFDCCVQQEGLATFKAGQDAISRLLRGTFAIFGNTMAFRRTSSAEYLPLPAASALYGGFHDIWIAVIMASIMDVGVLPDRLLAYRQHSGQWGGAIFRRPLSTRLRRLAYPCDPRPAVVAQLLVERLNSMNTREMSVKEAFRIVGAWSRHLAARETLPKRRVRRLPLIWREIISGQYSTFSKSFVSVAKDFVKTID